MLDAGGGAWNHAGTCEALGAHAAGIEDEPERSLGIDRRNGVDALPPAAGFDDRRLSSGSPRPLPRAVRTDPGFVKDEKTGAMALRPSAEFIGRDVAPRPA